MLLRMELCYTGLSFDSFLLLRHNVWKLRIYIVGSQVGEGSQEMCINITFYVGFLYLILLDGCGMVAPSCSVYIFPNYTSFILEGTKKIVCNHTMWQKDEFSHRKQSGKFTQCCILPCVWPLLCVLHQSFITGIEMHFLLLFFWLLTKLNCNYIHCHVLFGWIEDDIKREKKM